MGSYSVGEALNLVIEKSHWKQKITELRMREEWVEIVGKTIAKYTRNINMQGKTLTIYTDIAPLKHELMLGREHLVAKINEYFKDVVVSEIQVK